MATGDCLPLSSTQEICPHPQPKYAQVLKPRLQGCQHLRQKKKKKSYKLHEESGIDLLEFLIVVYLHILVIKAIIRFSSSLFQESVKSQWRIQGGA